MPLPEVTPDIKNALSLSLTLDAVSGALPRWSSVGLGQSTGAGPQNNTTLIIGLVLCVIFPPLMFFYALSFLKNPDQLPGLNPPIPFSIGPQFFEMGMFKHSWDEVARAYLNKTTVCVVLFDGRTLKFKGKKKQRFALKWLVAAIDAHARPDGPKEVPEALTQLRQPQDAR